MDSVPLQLEVPLLQLNISILTATIIIALQLCALVFILWKSGRLVGKWPFIKFDSQPADEELRNDISANNDIIKGINAFNNLTAASIMTSRLDIVTLDITTPFDKVIELISTQEYSRIPVLQGDYDNVRGILYAKDLIPHLGKAANFRWQTLIRQPYFVPENIKINNLFVEFQKNKIHIAVVADEFGGTSGIVTMEDILEEVVGEISDEHDDEERLYHKISENHYIFEGKMPLSDFIKLDCVDADDFQDELEDVESLAGMILELKQDFPLRNEIINYKKYRFTIKEIDARRILKIEMSIQNTDI